MKLNHILERFILFMVDLEFEKMTKMNLLFKKIKKGELVCLNKKKE